MEEGKALLERLAARCPARYVNGDPAFTPYYTYLRFGKVLVKVPSFLSGKKNMFYSVLP